MRSIGLYAFTALYSVSILLLLYLGRSFAALAWLIGIVAVSLLCMRAARYPWRIGVPCMAAGIGIAAMRITLLPAGLPEAFVPLLDQRVTLEGTVATIPDLRETNEKIAVDTVRSGERIRVLATVPLYPSVSAGDQVRVSGKLERPQPFDTDGGRTFAYDQYLRKDGILAVMSAAHAEVIGRSRSPWLMLLRWLEGVKSLLIQALGAALPEPESALADGILVGGKQGLGTRLIADFTASGMLQIIVLSGFNVMIVANALIALLARAPKNVSFAAATASIASFVLLSGAGSSAVRAGLMAAFAIAARTFGRRYDVLRVLCITFFLIAVWNPLMLAYDPGFQFSCIATLGLIIGTPIISPLLLFLRSRTLIEMVATTLAAEVSLLPLLLYETGNLSVVSVAANVAAMPAIPFAMAASAGAAALALPLQHLSSVLPVIIGLPAYVPLAYVMRIATLSASLPFANRVVRAFPFWIVIVSYAALALVARTAIVRVRPLRPGSDSPPRSSSGSRRTRLRTSSSPMACSPPCTHAPTGR